MAEHFFSPTFTTLVPGSLRKVLYNYTTTRDKIYLNGLGMTKGESGGFYMMMIKGMEVAQYYTVFNYGPPITQKCLKPQDRTIVSLPGMKLVPEFFLPGNSKEKVGKETTPDFSIMDCLENFLAKTLDQARGNTSGAIVERFIKPIASTMFGNPVYLMDGPGP